MYRALWAFTLAVSLCVSACARRQQAVSSAAGGVRSIVEAKTPPSYAADRGLWREVRRFYVQTEHAPAWSDGRRFRSTARQLTDAIDRANDDGLDPSDYDAEWLHALGSRPASESAAEADVRLTYDYLHFARDLAQGTIDPEDVNPQWHSAAKPVDLHETLRRALDERRVRDSLNELAPTAPQYAGLKSQLARNREIARTGGWPLVPEAPPLATGMRHAAVPTLRRRLAVTGDLKSSDQSSDLYDEAVARAVAAFQTRHGLEPDGKYTKAVAAAMNVPVDARVTQIEFNMDRWRWMPAELGERYLLVNIPAFRLDAVERGRSVLGMRVVAGKKENPTPVLADAMTYIVFSPYWNIPANIADQETVPHASKDAAYFAKNNIEVLRGSGAAATVVDPSTIDWSQGTEGLRFRQRPGQGNSLGLVKFIFPNHFNVYLHGTPSQSLFDRVERDFSHGCVRLEQPAKLAEYVLRDQPEWTASRIESAMHAGTEQTVNLKTPLPVYLVYFTAWEENGALHLRDDVYGHDRRQRTAVE
jgi:L,D-transpeptidase YcbB